jgi:hypothetical protein
MTARGEETFWFLIAGTSLELAQTLERMGLYYVFRVRKNANKAIKRYLSPPRLPYGSRYKVWAGITGLEQTKLVVFRTRAMQTFSILTNALHYTNDVLRQIYRKRWEVEEYFKMLKGNLRGNAFASHSLEEMRKELLFRVIAGTLTHTNLQQQGCSGSGAKATVLQKKSRHGIINRQKVYASFKTCTALLVLSMLVAYAWPCRVPIVFSLLDRHRMW